jgi:hypothetical protein
MNHKLSWRIVKSILDNARQQGEEIASVMGFDSPPIDPFKIIEEEPDIYAEGADFRDAFDGRLKYIGPRFLLTYNTKYNRWHHIGKHHPKVRFTVGHELGHYFLDEHRKYLLHGGESHLCFTEFQSTPYVERQADCFSAGLLMPTQLLALYVNDEPEPTFATIKQTARKFDVSITSLVVRWAQLSDFPCAAMFVSSRGIDWGWVSDGFKRIKGYHVRHNKAVLSEDARRFIQRDKSFLRYREGQGLGMAHQWIELDMLDISVQEFYAIIPYNRRMLVFISADEDEVSNQYESNY